jgi:hypothetical protein
MKEASMAILPDKDLEQIQFFENHLPTWSGTPAAIGLSAAQCTLLIPANMLHAFLARS